MPKYFAYGSNMSHDQICDRCPSQKFVCVAELREYTLAFTRYSKNRACGVADVVHAPGSSVWGVVYELSGSDMVELDRHEGAHLNPPAYVRRTVQVIDAEGQAHDAVTYDVASKASMPYLPSGEYLGLITEGARKWGLPQAYQDTLAQIRTEN
jgi:gamma-glutamylcyclotransferase